MAAGRNNRSPYDGMASWYGLMADPFEGPLRREAFTLADIRPGEYVLDAGCGPGSALKDLARRAAPGGRICGQDISKAMTDKARKRAADLIREGLVRIRTGDLREPYWETAYFDAILCSFTLETLAPGDAASVLADFRRILRPEGRLVLVHMAAVEGTPSLTERLYGRLRRARPDLIDCRPSDFSAALTRAGFRPDRVRNQRPLGLAVRILRAGPA